MPKIAYVGDFLPFLDPLHTIKTFSTKISCKIAHSMSSSISLQDFPARFSHKIFPQDFPARFSRKNFPQDFPARFSRKIFLQEFPARFSRRIFRKIFPQDFPARFSHKNFPQEFLAKFSRKNFSQDFPARFSLKIFPQDFPELDPDWLAPHHPIPNAKFPPITALLNRPTYHKRSKVSPPPFPQILWEPQINE